MSAFYDLQLLGFGGQLGIWGGIKNLSFYFLFRRNHYLLK